MVTCCRWPIQKMAEEKALREKNLILLSRLNVAQKAIWRDLCSIKTNSELSSKNLNTEKSTLKGFGLEKLRVKSQTRKTAMSKLSSAIEPRKKNENSCVKFQMTNLANKKENKTPLCESNARNSILKTPSLQHIKHIKQISLKVIKHCC